MGDSNPRAAFGDYTLSRRASSTTRATFQNFGLQKYHIPLKYDLMQELKKYNEYSGNFAVSMLFKSR